MIVKLLATEHIPDETWQDADMPAPTATNYAGAILEVSDELGASLLAKGTAVEVDPPPLPEAFGE